MPQNTAERTTSKFWDFLEPAIDPNSARTIHVKILAAGSGLTVAYPKGQVIRQKDDGTNVFAKDGVSGYTGPARIVKYPFVVNDAGYYQFGSAWATGQPTFETSIEAYYQGKFKTADLTLNDIADIQSVGRFISGSGATGIIDLGVGTAIVPA